MGLYDSFRLASPIECQVCHTAKSGLDEWQTKELGEWFCSFNVGDRVVFSGSLQLLDGTYPVYACCDGCGAWVEADIRIRDGIFVGLENIRFTPHQ
jgi:hypothetical protein